MWFILLTQLLFVVSASTVSAITLRSVLVVQIKFQDTAVLPWTPDRLIANLPIVDAFYRANSYDTIGLTFDVRDWVTVEAPSAPCDPLTWRSQADAILQSQDPFEPAVVMWPNDPAVTTITSTDSRGCRVVTQR